MGLNKSATMKITEPQDQSAFTQAVQNSSTRNLVRRIFRHYLSSYWKMIAVSLFMMTIAAMMTGGQALLMEHIIDRIFSEKNRSMLVPVSAAVFVTFFLRGLATYGHTVTMAKIGQRIVAKIQNDLFGQIIRSDMAFFHDNTSGSLISRMMSDVMVMRQAVAESLTGLGKNLVTLICLVAVMFYQDWKLALASFIVFPLAIVFVSKIGKKLRKVSDSTQEEMASFSSVLAQLFQGVRQVKAYGMEKGEEDRVGMNIDRLYKLSYKSARVSNLSTPVSEILTALAIITIIMYGGNQVMDGEKTAGALFSFITAFIMAYEPLKRLAKLNNGLQVGLAAADRVFRVMDTPRDIVNKPNATKLVIKTPSIQLKNVDFTYGDGTHALKNIDISVPGEKKVALVGPSGGGKSTVLNLIPRFFDVQKGQVLVDDHDIRDITLESLRAQIAFVSQEVIMFDDTVKANIAYGSEGKSDQDIIQAAKDAAAHDFIMELERGYDTRIGEQGLKLSGGQRQRIAIARAMLRDAPILLLDEATSALDTESERAVQAALTRLQKGRTTLVVAHRLSTVIDADIIYVLNNGRIVEKGSHENLMNAKGEYYKLYATLIHEDDVA